MLDRFGFVAPRTRWTGSVTRSAQPDQEGFLDLVTDLQVNTVLKLCSDQEFSDQKERDWLPTRAALHIEPMPGLFRFGEEACVLDLVKLIYENTRKGNNVHIHCTHGRDRTGLIVGAYQLLALGWHYADVEACRKNYGCIALINFFDQPDIEILKHLEGQALK